MDMDCLGGLMISPSKNKVDKVDCSCQLHDR